MRAAPLLLIALYALWAAVPAGAQAVITSAGPDKVSVTLYRDPDRGIDGAISRDSPQGYALITETRTVTIPAGETVIRFEGVAGNIMPESALVSGLPDGVEEKNLDASLLSPRSLFDRALGRRVMVRRTDPGTGKVTTQQATIRSSSAGAAVLEMGGVFGDLKCSGLPETLVYDGVPAGLSAKPTLSVRTRAVAERRVTLTLSYLAGGFDWQADYIIAMRADGRSADLFAWITLASTDVTSFVDADTQVVAGKPNRSGDSTLDTRNYAAGGDLALRCWPMPRYNLYALSNFAAPAPPPPAMMAEGMMDIVVTAQRVQRRGALSAVPIAVLATAEQLGDLKLYRFPTRVTVASQAQKQVAMMSKPAVKLAPVYVTDVRGESADTAMLLRGKNVTANGLGLPLPAGGASVYAEVDGEQLLVGESAIEDKTIGEIVEFDLGEPLSVSAEAVGTKRRDRDRKTYYVLTVTNDQPWPIAYEAKIHLDEHQKMIKASRALGKKDGEPFWSTNIPANGTATLNYVVLAGDGDDGDD